MIARAPLSAALLPGLIALAACGCKNVARYAPCTGTETCASSTTCESFSATSSTAGADPTFCTWSCGSGANESSCPKDANGVEGICVAGINGATVGSAEYGFCFQDCSSGSTCPAGETCQPAEPFSESTQSMVCVPTFNDPLSGTSWQSSTIAPAARSDGVTTSTYAITLGRMTDTQEGYPSGPFSATLTQVFGSSALQYAGCTETTTFSGGQWIDLPTTTTSAGLLDVINVNGVTNRTGCTFDSDDVTGEVDSTYVETVSGTGQGASYSLSDTSMIMQGGNGVTPYSDAVSWTFTEM